MTYLQDNNDYDLAAWSDEAKAIADDAGAMNDQKDVLEDDFDLFADLSDSPSSQDKEEGRISSLSENKALMEDEPQKEEDGEDIAQAEQYQEPTTYQISYMGEEKSLTLEELKDFAEKGLNYDRIKPKYEVNKEIAVKVKEMADKAGMSRDDFIQYLDGSISQNKISAEAQRLMREEMLDEPMAMRLATTNVEKDELKRQLEEKSLDEESQKQRDAALRDDLKELLTFYPEVKNLPTEILPQIEQGMKPLAAYQSYLLHQKEVELEQIKQTKKNDEKNPGSLKGESMGDKDPFLQGLLADI